MIFKTAPKNSHTHKQKGRRKLNIVTPPPSLPLSPPPSLPLFLAHIMCLSTAIWCRTYGTESLSILSWCDGALDQPFMVDPLRYFLFQPVFHDWCNKGCGMCYPVCGMVHIKEPLLLIDKSSL